MLATPAASVAQTRQTHDKTIHSNRNAHIPYHMSSRPAHPFNGTWKSRISIQTNAQKC